MTKHYSGSRQHTVKTPTKSTHRETREEIAAEAAEGKRVLYWAFGIAAIIMLIIYLVFR